MIGPIVPQLQRPQHQISAVHQRSGHTMDPLSEVLALLKPQSYFAGGFAVRGEIAIQFPKHQGIKCYAVLTGQAG
jgi:hypothetical protein